MTVKWKCIEIKIIPNLLGFVNLIKGENNEQIPHHYVHFVHNPLKKFNEL